TSFFTEISFTVGGVANQHRCSAAGCQGAPFREQPSRTSTFRMSQVCWRFVFSLYVAGNRLSAENREDSGTRARGEGIRNPSTRPGGGDSVVSGMLASVPVLATLGCPRVVARFGHHCLQ